MSELGAGFVRVSTGSQDETSQIKIFTEESAQRGITIVKWFKLHGYSASHGRLLRPHGYRIVAA
jgi:hypothetical protein